MKKKIFQQSLMALSIAGALLFGGSVAAADLMQVYQQAVENDPTLASARAEWEAAQEKVPQARAQFMPQVSGQANTSYSNSKYTYYDYPTGYGTTYDRKEDGSYSSYGYGISAQAPIFRYQNFVNYGMAKEQVNQADIVLRQKKQDLMLKTASTYFDVLLAEIEVGLAQSQKQALSEQLEQAKSQYKAGVVAVTDVNESKAKFDIVRADEVVAQNRLTTAQLALQTIIGSQPLPLAKIRDNYLPVSAQPNDVQHWVERAQVDHPKVRIAESNAKLSGYNVKKAESGHYPTLDLQASWNDRRAEGQSDSPDQKTQDKTGQVALTLNVPIFQGGYVSSMVREAVSTMDAAQQQLEGARREAIYDAQTGFYDITNAISAIEAYQQAVKSSEVALESVRRGQRGGIRTTLDVLNAQQTLYTNRRDLAASYFKYFNGYLKLKYSAGDLTEEDLATLNRALE